MTNNLKAERTLTAERLTPDQIDKAWELIDRLENFQSYRGEELDDGDYTDISVAIYFLRNLLPSQSLSTQQPMGEVTVPNERWSDREPIYEAAIAAYEANTPSDYRYSAIAMVKAVDAAISVIEKAIESALHPNQESGE